MATDILRPVVVLIGWMLVMLVWAVATRLPAMAAAGIDLRTLIGSKAADADRVLPPGAQWKAHNYNHLHEQPTLFYAVCLVLSFIGAGHDVNVTIAWIYVGLRVAHSLEQAIVNRVAVRFALFILSSLALTALTLHAGMVLFGEPL
ncbi:MAPEG family protein [uncultured Sphingomonas sp.]|uniref:MAPEG family protein n=1 Tax=uncultured Sphingomonas sp. TaxID=158754 RepID=UPI0035CC45CA